MPNGGNWDRFWFVIMGFRVEYGRWPTRVIAPEVTAQDVKRHLGASGLARLRQRLTIEASDFGLSALDESGARYDYNGPVVCDLHQERMDWFGIAWD